MNTVVYNCRELREQAVRGELDCLVAAFHPVLTVNIHNSNQLNNHCDCQAVRQSRQRSASDISIKNKEKLTLFRKATLLS